MKTKKSNKTLTFTEADLLEILHNTAHIEYMYDFKNRFSGVVLSQSALIDLAKEINSKLESKND